MHFLCWNIRNILVSKIFCFATKSYNVTCQSYDVVSVFKPLSHWDATSSRWVCESIRQTVANCRETFAWYRKVLACIANSSRTGRQSFKHVILFCATKIIAKPSPSHRICREPVGNPSPTLRRRSQTHRREVIAICTMRQICDINKIISRLNCDK